MKTPTVLDKLQPVQVAPSGTVAARTRDRLLGSAHALIRRDGRVPSISEVAQAASVSRATAYRYFATRSRLIAAVVDDSLGPMRNWQPGSDDAQTRVEELLDSTFGRFKEFEIPMRAALQLALEHAALERAGLLEEEPYRRGYRVRILQTALAPLKPRLPRRTYERLWCALSLVYGIEPYVVLKDIWGADDAHVEDVARWMAGALMRQAMTELRPASGRGAAQAEARSARETKPDGAKPDGAKPDGVKAHGVKAHGGPDDRHRSAVGDTQARGGEGTGNGNALRNAEAGVDTPGRGRGRSGATRDGAAGARAGTGAGASGASRRARSSAGR